MGNNVNLTEYLVWFTEEGRYSESAEDSYDLAKKIFADSYIEAAIIFVASYCPSNKGVVFEVTVANYDYMNDEIDFRININVSY
jgi:hypothetical protein